MARKKTTLNLTPELPEVRSTDFNLFYRPEVAPRDNDGGKQAHDMHEPEEDETDDITAVPDIRSKMSAANRWSILARQTALSFDLVREL